MPADPGPEEIKVASAPRELAAEEVTFSVSAASLGFTTTAEITATPDWVGQERALAALELGLGVTHAGYTTSM